MTHGNQDLGALPYKEPRAGDPGVAWLSLAMIAVFGGLLVSFTVYDLTHGDSAIRPILPFVLVVVACFALVLMLMNVSWKKRAQDEEPKYKSAKQFAWQMFALCALCVILFVLLMVLP